MPNATKAFPMYLLLTVSPCLQIPHARAMHCNSSPKTCYVNPVQPTHLICWASGVCTATARTIKAEWSLKLRGGSLG